MHHGVGWQLVHGTFFAAFWPAIAAALIAGLLLLALTYRILERKLHVFERRERSRLAVRAALMAVRKELKDDSRQARTLLRVAPEPALPYPLFDVNGWELVTQPEVMVALDPDTFGVLMAIYNRMRTANEQFAFVYDLLWGPTTISVSTQAFLAFSAGNQSAHVSTVRFEAHRQEQLDRLVDRVTELRPVMHDAIILVRRELAAIDAQPRRSLFGR